VRQIRTLRAMRRELETDDGLHLHGHAGGNPGDRQGAAYASPRQFLPDPTSRRVIVVEGLILSAHSIGVDSKGNVYVGESPMGQRTQSFVKVSD
jgi:hypothetical protein